MQGIRAVNQAHRFNYVNFTPVTQASLHEEVHDDRISCLYLIICEEPPKRAVFNLELGLLDVIDEAHCI